MVHLVLGKPTGHLFFKVVKIGLWQAPFYMSGNPARFITKKSSF
jgi:hypothetical protein